MGLLSILAAGAICAAPTAHDGDSVRCGGERIRIANIDAPELPGSPKCKGARSPYADCDFATGLRARDALRAFLATGPLKVQRFGPDRYGRTLARVTVNGRDAGEYLVRLGLARRWRSGGGWERAICPNRSPLGIFSKRDGPALPTRRALLPGLARFAMPIGCGPIGWIRAGGLRPSTG